MIVSLERLQVVVSDRRKILETSQHKTAGIDWESTVRKGGTQTEGSKC